MKHSVRGRALVVVAATASLLALPLATSASAVTQPGACKTLKTKSGSGGSIVATVSRCTPLAATGGSGTGTFKAGQVSGKLNATIKWAKGKGTTKATVSLAPQATKGKCPAGTTRIKVTGKVTGGTGAAAKTFKKGQPATASICANAKTGSASLEPGTSLKF
jgi:hypothetical protein